MPLLVWTAALVGVWCTASAVAALVVGPALRRRVVTPAPTGSTPPAESAPPVTSPRGASLDPLDTGPMRMWLAELPEVPEPRRPTPSPTS